MHRRKPWLSGTFGVLLAAAAAMAAPTLAEAKPNIVLILADDMMAADVLATPRTRALIGRAGATFKNAFVGVSLCCPSRATILTGRYPQNTGVYTNGGSNGGWAIFRDNGSERATIATWLKAAGYRTAFVGKYLNGYPGGRAETVPPGWDVWVAPVDGFDDQFDYTLNVNGARQRYGTEPVSYGTDVLARKAAGFIKQVAAKDKPFLLVVSPFAPHSPAVAAPRHAGLYREATVPKSPALFERDVSDKPSFYRLPPLTEEQRATIEKGYRQRLRSLAAVDEMVELIVKTLTSTGELDNTYLLFTSDNGFKLGHHRLGVNKQSEFDSDIRVPLMIRGPRVRADIKIDALVNNADFAPTFAAWAGARPTRAPDGRSLVPLLDGVAPKVWRHSFPLAHGRKQSQAVRTWTALGLFQGVPYVLMPDYYGLRARQWMFTRSATGERQLYNLRNDPYELENLARKAPSGVEATIAARAKALAACAGAECRTLENKPLPAP